jgi:8-oxo-dGTP diphosphatase
MPQIQAAGGVLWSMTGGERQFAVLHRPRYDDWSLPKGKNKAGEHPVQTAFREVIEETGVTPIVGHRLPGQQYQVTEGDKSVDWWAMQAAGGRFTPGDEVDELRWLSAGSALDLLTYERDRALLRDIGDVPSATVLLIRHAKAGDRKSWPDDDRLRPLDQAGRKQAGHIAEIVPCWHPGRVASADLLRCTQTVAPLAETLTLPVEIEPTMSEDAYAAEPDAALARIRELAAAGGISAIASQGGAIPGMVSDLADSDGLDLAEVPAKKGSMWALFFAGSRLIGADYYPDFKH